MKIVYVLVCIIIFSTLIEAQIKSVFEKEISPNRSSWFSSTTEQKNREISKRKVNRYSDLVTNPHKISPPDSTITTSPDSMKYNMYGDLLNDNPLYNERSSVWMVALRVTLSGVTTNLIDHYILNFDFSRVGFNSWKHNLKTGWEWDNDRFAMNNFFHPFSGGMYFNAARANGYSFFESIPFAAFGSLEWEYFGETTLPSKNDIINTTINGAFLGEIFYRLGSNILDDQTTGFGRFLRESAVAVITPTRFFSRLLQGKVFRLTPEEVYQKEPLNLTLSAGYHRVNSGTAKEKSSNSFNFNLHLDYGNPFEKIHRKPYDYFKVRTDLDFGVGRKMIDLLTGYGMLFGSNLQTGNLEMLLGLFQHMNFFDNKTFELADIAFGPGIISKLPISRNSSIYTDLHAAIVPFGALSGRLGPDTTQVRDYNYTAGTEIKFESTLNLGGWTGISITGYYWWFRTIIGNPGNSYVALIQPSIKFRLFNNVNIGFEHLIYYSDKYPRDFPGIHSVRTEQKILLQIFFEEFKFKR